MSVSVQPLASSAAKIGPASGASSAAVAPVAGIMGQQAEIVRKTEKLMKFERHAVLLLIVLLLP